MLWQVTAYPVAAQPEDRCIDYTTHTPNDVLIGVLYVAVTCGPALMSSRRCLRWFGLISLVGVIAVALVRAGELTSLWCLYAALVSVLILEHFRRQRSSEAHRDRVASPVPMDRHPHMSRGCQQHRPPATWRLTPGKAQRQTNRSLRAPNQPGEPARGLLADEDISVGSCPTSLEAEC